MGRTAEPSELIGVKVLSHFHEKPEYNDLRLTFLCLDFPIDPINCSRFWIGVCVLHLHVIITFLK